MDGTEFEIEPRASKAVEYAEGGWVWLFALAGLPLAYALARLAERTARRSKSLEPSL